MKISVDVRNNLVTIDGIVRTVSGLMPEYQEIDLVNFDMETTEGVITHKSRKLSPVSITSIAILQTAIARWDAARPSYESVWQEIKAKRTEAKLGGVQVGDNWFFTDADSIGQYSVMYAAIAVNSLPNAYVFAKEWKTMRGNKVPMTAGLLKAVVGSGMRNEVMNFANAEAHKASMLSRPNPGSYDFSGGWTKGFA